MNLISYELTKLVDDYYRCENNHIREQILSDIHLLTEAVTRILEQESTKISD